MAGKTDVFSNDILKLIFNGTAIADLAENDTSAPSTLLYIRLHTADPTDTPASGQATSEATYTGYAAQSLVRTNAGWTVTGKTVSPSADVIFGKCTAGTQTITHASIGTAATGAGKMLYSGALTPNIAVTVGVKPIIEAGSTLTEE